MKATHHPPKVRLFADLSPEVAQALTQLADDQNISLIEALSRAISTEKVLHDLRQQGAKIVIDEHGKLSEMLFAR